MTMDERIEAAAKALVPMWWTDTSIRDSHLNREGKTE